MGSDGERDAGNELVQHAVAEGQSNENDWNPASTEGLMKSEDWLWNLDNWKVWKEAFKEITKRVDDVRVHEVVRSEATKALKVMEELETL